MDISPSRHPYFPLPLHAVLWPVIGGLSAVVLYGFVSRTMTDMSHVPDKKFRSLG